MEFESIESVLTRGRPVSCTGTLSVLPFKLQMESEADTLHIQKRKHFSHHSPNFHLTTLRWDLKDEKSVVTWIEIQGS